MVSLTSLALADARPADTLGTFISLMRVHRRSLQPACEQSQTLKLLFRTKENRVMISNKIRRVIVFALLCGFVALLPVAAGAQEPSPTARLAAEDANLEIQVYLILASNSEIEDARLPVTLDPIIKQLRESLPFKHFNLAATFLNRVKNNGKLELTWMAGPFALRG